MTLLELQLKRLKSAQLSQVMELDKICFGGFWSLDGYRREMESPNSTLLIITIPSSEGEKVIGLGCFWCILEEAHITLLAVHPDFQHQGLGKLLLFSLLKDAVKRNLERATLEVKETNQIALSLYDKFGFKLAGKRKNYYPKTGEDALVFWLSDLSKPEFKETLKIWEENLLNNQFSVIIKC
jgi:ribosomal-protein-alanine N-acetyltransferase